MKLLLIALLLFSFSCQTATNEVKENQPSPKPTATSYQTKNNETVNCDSNGRCVMTPNALKTFDKVTIGMSISQFSKLCNQTNSDDWIKDLQTANGSTTVIYRTYHPDRAKLGCSGKFYFVNNDLTVIEN